MINNEFFQALDMLEKEKKISKAVLIESLEAGLASAIKREEGESRPVTVTLNPEKGIMIVKAHREVVEEPEDTELQVSLEEAREIDPNINIGDTLYEDITPKDFSRIAAQTAKQVIMQRLNDARKTMVMSEMSEREGEIMNAIVRRVEGSTVYVEMAGTQMEGVMLIGDQLKGEVYKVNDVIKVYVKNIRNTPKGAQVLVSRSAAGFVKRLFELECPELKAGLIGIKNIVREAGMRTKLAVYSEDSNIDAVGAIIGPKGSRINMVVSELNGEKIDVIGYCEDALEYIARALTPAKVMMVQINEEEKAARAIVPDDKLSLAIGKGGHNVKLAARLTGWKIDVKPYSTLLESMENAVNADAEVDAE